MILLSYPPANNRYYRHYRGMTVLSAEGKAFKTEAAWRCKAAGMRVLDGNVELQVILHPRQNKDGAASKVRIDLDSPLKAVCDSLNGIGYEDDAQIVRIIAEVGSPVPNGGVSVCVRAA